MQTTFKIVDCWGCHNKIRKLFHASITRLLKRIRWHQSVLLRHFRHVTTIGAEQLCTMLIGVIFHMKPRDQALESLLSLTPKCWWQYRHQNPFRNDSPTCRSRNHINFAHCDWRYFLNFLLLTDNKWLSNNFDSPAADFLSTAFTDSGTASSTRKLSSSWHPENGTDMRKYHLKLQ